MKIAFVGSRKFCDKEFVEQIVEHELMHGWVDYVSKKPHHDLVSGGAIGVDSWAEEVGKQLNVVCHIYLPDWEKHGKSAGFKRNELIINAADKVVAFWDGQSKGTKHSIDLAIAAKKPVDIYIRN